MSMIFAKDLRVGDIVSFVFAGLPKEEVTDKITIEDVHVHYSGVTGYSTDGKSFSFRHDQLLWLFSRDLPQWKEAPQPIVGEPVIDDYEVMIVFNDGTKTALYFKELDFIKDLGWTNVDKIGIKARWRNS